MRVNIAHVALWTRDLHQAAAFWRRYFDADVGDVYRSGRRPGFESRFVTLPGGGAKIELMTGPWLANDVATRAEERIGWDHLAIAVDARATVDTLAARCAADGLLVAPPRTTGDGFYEAVIAMPDGTRIEITA